MLLMWVLSPGMPGAKAANPYNEINQKAPRLPASSLEFTDAIGGFKLGDMNRKYRYTVYTNNLHALSGSSYHQIHPSSFYFIFIISRVGFLYSKSITHFLQHGFEV